MLEHHQTTSQGSKKASGGPESQVSGARQCSAPVKPQGLGQHSHINPSSNANSHHSGAAESIAFGIRIYSIFPPLPCWLVLPWGLKQAMDAYLRVSFPREPPLHHPSSLPPSSSSPGESAEDAQPGCSQQLGSQGPRGKTCRKVLGKS